MSNDLISRNALLTEYSDFKDMDCPSGHTVTADYMIELAEDAPAVDAEPVRHGRWIWADDGYLRCSECTQKAPITTQYQDEPIQTATDYCPHCGTKMDGDKNA